MDKRIFDPHFVLLNDRHRLLDEQYGRIDGVSIHVVGHRKSFDPRRLTDLVRLLRQLRPDLIHTVLPTANLWGLLAARRIGIRPCIGSLRGLRHRRLDRWYWIDRLTLRYLADAVVVNSDTVKDNCIRKLGVKPHKIHRIYNGIRLPKVPDGDRTEFLQSLGVRSIDRPVVSVLGRLDVNKSFSDVLEAVRLLLDRDRPPTLLVGGSGPCLSALQLQARCAGIENHVVFLGPVRDVSMLFRCTDLFVCASRSEGFPNVVLEAMASGVFVVATDISAHRELIRHEKTGVLFEPGNPRALAEAIQKGLDHPDTCRAVACQARAEAESRFSLGAMVQSYQDLYRQWLGKSAL
jgi:glycosyltransferase involved in cell wall biosynthesis